jgi:hypothetical protein
MKNKLTKNYLPGGNTPEGFHSFYQYLPHKAEEVFIIKGGPGTGKSTFMKRIAEKGINQDLNVELHWCSSDNNSLDGIVIPDRKIAILDGTAPHTTDPIYPGVIEEILNFGKCWDKEILKKHKNKIVKLTREIKNYFEMTYLYLHLAKKPFNKEKSYIENNLNNRLIGEKINELIQKIFASTTNHSTLGRERHLFGTGITPEGHVNFLKQPNINKNYLLLGPAGSGKSKIINHIGKTAIQKGHNVLFLHCSFEPDKLDGVIINSNNTAVLDASEPHTITQDKTTQVINTDNLLSNKITNNKNIRLELNQIYTKMLNQALDYLSKAKSTHDELEKYYIDSMDFDGIDKMRKDLENYIF